MADAPMEDAEVPPVEVDDGEGGGLPGRRSVLALLGAALLVVVVLALVLVFGVARPPELMPLTDATARPAVGVAWTAWGTNGACVSIGSPDGSVRELRCERDGGDVIAWTDEGVIVRRWMQSGETDLVLDPASGEVIDRRAVDDETYRAWPAGVRSYREDGALVVELETTDQVIWRVEAAETYDIYQGALSPDGNWVAMGDSADRLLVVPADGSGPPLVWSGDFDAWQVVVWEGADVEP